MTTEPQHDGAEGAGSIDFAWLLDLHRIDRDLYVAPSPNYRNRYNLFGGQVAAQALRAASLSVETDHRPHSFHLYFMRAGTIGQPVVLYVNRIRDGRSFTTRNVVAQQNGEAILTMSASFHRPETSSFHFEMPRAEAPLPSGPGAPDEDQPRHGMARIEIVPVPTDDPRFDRSWMRLGERLPDDDPVLHACALAYMSDVRTGHAPLKSVGATYEQIMMTSLDHALHFHRHVRADEWLLFDFESVSVGNGRCMTRAAIHAPDGTLGATLQQELLLRDLDPERAAARAARRNPPDML